MSRIAFYLDTATLKQIDLSDVDAGNPGIGGTEYMFFLVASHLARVLEVHVYTTRPGRFPPGLHCHQVADFADAVARFREQGERWVVLRESELLPNASLIRHAPQRFIAWAHNYSNHRILRFCEATAGIVRYLCVSREQYENLRDEPVFRKSGYIFNAAATGAYRPPPAPPGGNRVFYMGNIIPQKGFHILARHWPEIRRAVPDAQLHIVGSGQLYDRSIPMGPLGIATADYERQFARHLTRDGRLREDVIFHGTLGSGKNELLGSAKVAVVNPTGQGETFCLSALEFELLGVPVVTRNLGGPRNVVQDGSTGILYDRERQLGAAVVRLLRDDRLRAGMSVNAVAYARSRFDIGTVVEDWVRLLAELEAGREPLPDYRITGGGAGLKRAKDLNRRLKALPGLGWLPSLDRSLHLLRKKTQSLFVKPWNRLRERMAYSDHAR